MLNNKIDSNLSLDEITLIPDVVTDIKSRKLVDPYVDGKHLPVFVAPMTCVLNSENIRVFDDAGFIPILPRGITDSDWYKWRALSLSEFENCVNAGTFPSANILVDVANGHMKCIYDSVKKSKEKYPMIKIMVGNIANPDTYKICCDVGADYVRVGIAGGNGCKTCRTGIHASHTWMLSKISEIQKTCYFHSYTKVVADGGIDTTDKAIKCLALGADFVMMGKTFGMCKEACGEIVNIKGKTYRSYYGMASQKGMSDISKDSTNTPEGVEKLIEVTTDIKSFSKEFEDYLRSAMSYQNCMTLEEFRDNGLYEIQTINEFGSYYK